MASKTQMERYLAAAVQMSSGADRPANLARAEALVREAAGRGARLVVLPEVFAWRGPRPEEAAVAEPIPGPTTERLAALAHELAIHLSAGSLLEKTPGEPRAYNTSCLFDPSGALVARDRKHPCYLVAPDQTGTSPHGFADYGESLIVDPWGRVLARASEGEGVITAEIDRAYLARVRRELPCLAHVRLGV